MGMCSDFLLVWFVVGVRVFCLVDGFDEVYKGMVLWLEFKKY